MSTTCPPVHPSGGVPKRRGSAAAAAVRPQRPYCSRSGVVVRRAAREYGRIDRFAYDCAHNGRSGYRGRFLL